MGGGIRTLSKEMHKTGRIIGAAVVTPDDDLTLITSGGIALRTNVNTINTYSRSTSGVKLIDLADDDVLVSMAIVGEQKRAEPTPDNGTGEHLPDLYDELDDDESLDDIEAEIDAVFGDDEDYEDDDESGEDEFNGAFEDEDDEE